MQSRSRLERSEKSFDLWTTVTLKRSSLLGGPKEFPTTSVAASAAFSGIPRAHVIMLLCTQCPCVIGNSLRTRVEHCLLCSTHCLTPELLYHGVRQPRVTHQSEATRAPTAPSPLVCVQGHMRTFTYEPEQICLMKIWVKKRMLVVWDYTMLVSYFTINCSSYQRTSSSK